MNCVSQGKLQQKTLIMMSLLNAGGSSINQKELIQILIRASVVSVVTYFSVKWMINQLDPTSKGKKKAKAKAEEQLRR